MQMVSKESLSERILHTLCDVRDIDRSRVTLQTDLADIDFDSIIMTAVITDIESAYAIELSADKIISLFESVLVEDLASRIWEAVVAAKP